jgi:hypothetical protein
MQRARRVAITACLRLVVFVTAMLTVAGTCFAQAGDVRVRVTLPEVLVLGYYPEIRVLVDGPGHFTAAARSALASSAGEGSVDVAIHVDGRFLEALGGAEATEFASGLIPSAIAVRGTSNSGRTSLRIEVESTTALHPAGGLITATEALASVGATTGSAIDFATPGIGDTVVADIAMTLDLREARNGGWHEGIRLRVTAENL